MMAPARAMMRNNVLQFLRRTKTQAVWLTAFPFLFAPGWAAGAPATSANVRQWLSTADRSALVAEQKETLPFGSVANQAPTVEVNDVLRFQTMDGFGFAL